MIITVQKIEWLGGMKNEKKSETNFSMCYGGYHDYYRCTTKRLCGNRIAEMDKTVFNRGKCGR